MSNVKFTSFRYNLLDSYFRRFTNPMTIEEILGDLQEQLSELDASISERTLRNDIKLFKDVKNGFGAPLESQVFKGRHVYVYTDPKFSISNKDLLEQEKRALNDVQFILERFPNVSRYNRLASALMLFNEEEKSSSNEDYKIILFPDENELYEAQSMHLFNTFYDYIKDNKVLKFIYTDFNEKTEEYIFHPYVLREYNQRWFVYGYNEAKKNNWSLPLDSRISKEIEILEDKTYKEDTTDWKEFFRVMIGVRKESQTQAQENKALAERVILKFNPIRLGYFETKPLHPDWDYKDYTHEDGTVEELVFIPEIIINLEFIQQLLSYGADVEVIEPLALREIMKEQTERLGRIYK